MQVRPKSASKAFVAAALAVLLPHCDTEPATVDLDAGVTEDATGLQDAPGDATDAPNPTLGQPCRSDSDCTGTSWCSEVSGFERCAPRVFGGTPHQMDFVFVPAGTFQQGTPGAKDHERPFSSTISRNYFVSRTEVTQGQWTAATGATNPSHFQNTTCISSFCWSSENANPRGPVEQVDWYSALAYANWLSAEQGLSECYALTGCTDPTNGWHDGDHRDCTGATFVGPACTGYRLLTESEWEYAARGGTTSTYYWGEATDAATIERYAWFGSELGGRTQPVGGKEANAYGLFDMSGNVWEWVWDGIFANGAWVNYPHGNQTDYTGPAVAVTRGVRGGDWGGTPSSVRSAARISNGRPDGDGNDLGIRLARTAH